MKVHYFKIGVFVLSSLLLAVAAVVVLGAGALFRKEIICETYFEESVQGLDVGSAVKFRGVEIGKVETITLANKEYQTKHQYVIVRSSLFPEDFGIRDKKALKEEVNKGLRIKMALLGITGAAYLETDYLEREESAESLAFEWTPRYPYIPSVPSTITRVSEALDSILKNLENINVQGIAENLDSALESMGKLLEATNLENITTQGEQLISEVRKTNQEIKRLVEEIHVEPLITDASATVATARRIVEDAEGPLTGFVDDLNEISKRAQSLMAKFDAMSEGVPETVSEIKKTVRELDTFILQQKRDIESTVDNFRKASENLKEASENATRYPSQTLFGEPPPRSLPAIER